MSLLKAEGIKKSYREASGKLTVLKDVNLEVMPQDLIALTGQSGSGKSTLLHLLGMLDSYDAGKIYYFDEEMNIYHKNVNEFRNKKIGFVFQFHYLLEDFTAEENVAMPMFIANKNFTASLKKARSLLRSFDIFERRKHYPNQLSGGEQQRVAVARALINDAEIIFADEPTGNLDNEHSREMLDLLIDLNKTRGETILLATHNIGIANRMKRHLHLQNGIIKEL